VLELRRVFAGYDDTTVLRAIDLTVPDRSVVALLGPNGAGKTTLLRVASGILRPRAGEMLLDGASTDHYSPHDLVAAGVCHVPEGRGIWKSMTVRDHLELYSPAGRVKESVERAVAAFPKLGQRMSQLAGTMSGGEQQMLALARAYVQQPRLVLVDEVSMGLAPTVVDEIFEFLRTLASEGCSLLLVEQYFQRALEIADYAYVMTRGRLSFAGEPGELIEEDLAHYYIGAGFDAVR
jgi:branched-chain amino acid transport system ATP-binding protein